MSAVQALLAAPPALTPAPSRLLQRACACGGAASLTGHCSSCESKERFGTGLLQPKLQMNVPGDVYEQEADRIADQVVALPTPRSRHDELTPAGPALQRQPLRLIQRQPANDDQEGLAGEELEEQNQEQRDDEETIQTRRAPNHGHADTGPGFHAQLDAERAGGSPLPTELRVDMETRFGVDLGHVRVHRGARPASLARAIQAEAFTLGEHIFFNDGYYDPASRRGRHLLAHELTHTVQQARGNIRSLPPAAMPRVAASSEAVPVIQRRVEDSFVPPILPGGELVHETVLKAYGEKNKQLFTEAPIPGATRSNTAEAVGRADLYVDESTSTPPTVPAVLMQLGQPSYFQPQKLRKNAKPFEHRQKGAPIARLNGCDGAPAFFDDNRPEGTEVHVCSLDKAPTKMQLGDLKPPPSIPNYFGDRIQLANYDTGIKNTKDGLNTWIDANKSNAHPSPAHWNPTTGRVGKLDDPDAFKLGGTDGKLVKLRLYGGEKTGPAIEGLWGRAAVYKSTEPGVWTYEWVPDEIPAALVKNASEPRVTTALTRLNDLVAQVKSPPVAVAGGKKSLAGTPRRKPILRRPSAIQRKTSFDAKTWPAAFKSWQETDAKPILGSDAIGPVGKVGIPTPESDAAKAVDVLEGARALKARLPAAKVPKGLAKVPNAPTGAAGGMRRMRMWARWGPLLGRLRIAMGGVFVKIATLYDKAVERFERTRSAFKAKEPDTGGSIGKAIISGVFKVATTFFKVLVDRVAGELKRGLKQAGTVIVEDLIGEERMEKIAEAEAEFQSMVDGVETRVNEAIEDVRAILRPYEDIFEALSWIKDKVSDIMRLVSAVRWGLRIIQCVTPPGLGCLKLLLQAVVEELAAKVIGSCWFTLNFIKPMLTTFDIFTKLPGQIGGFILEQVKKLAALLPISPEVLDKAFKPPAVRTGVSASDLECDAKVITPAQRAMNALLDKYGEDKIREMIKLLEAAGMTNDREMTMADVKILEGLLANIEDGTVTKEDIGNAVANMKQGKPGGVPNIDNAIKQLSGLGGGSGGGSGSGSGSGDGSGTGGIRSVPFDQAKSKFSPAGGTVSGTMYKAMGVTPDQAKGQPVTLTLGGFVNGKQVTEVTGVPAKVAEVRDTTEAGKAQHQPYYSISSTILFTHDVKGVPSFVADPSKLIPGTKFGADGKPVKAAPAKVTPAEATLTKQLEPAK